jgi:hypothetical protein
LEVAGRALRTQRRAEALGVSPDKLPQDDVELGLFSFWDTDKLPLGRASSGKRGTGETKRHSDLVPEASSKKLRWASLLLFNGNATFPDVPSSAACCY